MTSVEIVAYIGALAWLPQIINWAHQYYSKPQIRIIPDRNAQLGYTSFGPIFNIRVSIDVAKKDALLDYIGIVLKHDSGSSFEFEWTGMNQMFSEVISIGDFTSDNKQIVQRDMNPIAIKLSLLSLTDAFIRFQETKFIQDNRIHNDQLTSEIESAKILRKEHKNTDFITRAC